MGELESEILCVFCAYVMKRNALTQPQRHRGTETIFSAGPHPHNSAKSLQRFKAWVIHWDNGDQMGSNDSQKKANKAMKTALGQSLPPGVANVIPDMPMPKPPKEPKKPKDDIAGGTVKL